MGAAPGDLGVPLGHPLGRPAHHVETGVGGVEVALLGLQLGVGALGVGVGVGAVGRWPPVPSPRGRSTDDAPDSGNWSVYALSGTRWYCVAESRSELLGPRDLRLVEEDDPVAESQPLAVVLEPEAAEVRDEPVGVAAEVALDDAHDAAVGDHEHVAVVRRRDRVERARAPASSTESSGS